MEESYGEYVAPTDAIRDILRAYPLSIGLLREIIQNSDDAKAKKQIFLLDYRQHSIKSISEFPYLKQTQGPALLAHNDGLLQEKDWTALKEIHRSSKATDTEKTGKYGLGFRSCYHVTDTPEILSGSHLAILDPHYHCRKDGGVRYNIVENYEQLNDHLSAFEPLFPRFQWGQPYNGTLFRFPLRAAPSGISNKVISAVEIAELLRNFAHEELSVSLLFLRNISSIDVCEITDDDQKVIISSASISRGSFEAYGPSYLTREVTIQVSAADVSDKREEWRILHAPFPQTEALEKLSERLEWSNTRTKRTLSEEKLNPTVDLAVSKEFSSLAKDGRLFTFLPLPLKTNFPVHINCVFSLTQSRQNLRNAGEVGIVRDSEDRARVEWNRLLFDTYIPQAWATLLEVLVNKDYIHNIFVVWPKAQADVHSGDAIYWKNMPVDVADHALGLDVWPISGTSPPSYQRISSLIVEERSVELEGVVAALVRTGVQITRLPKYLTNIIVENFLSSIQVLSPGIAFLKLGAFVTQLNNLDDEDARVILAYLLSTSNCNYICGLPLVPSVTGCRITLQLTAFLLPSHVIFDETEEVLFGEYDTQAISLRRMMPTARQAINDYGAELLNVVHLRYPRVIEYLGRSPYASQTRGSVGADEITWLNLFWKWVKPAESPRYATRFFLVPTTTCTQRPADLVFDPEGDVTELTGPLEALGIPVIDPRFEKVARSAVPGVRLTSDIYCLLDTLPPSTSRSVNLSERDSRVFCAYLVQHLPRASGEDGPLHQHPLLFDCVRSLPVFPLVFTSEDGQLTTSRGSIPVTHNVRGVNPLEVPILPQVENLAYINLNSVDIQILKHLNTTYTEPLTPHDMQVLMLKFFTSQSPGMRLSFVEYLSKLAVLPQEILDNLRSIRFMLASNGIYQAPEYLIDPLSPIAALFSAPSDRLPSLTRPTFSRLSELLSKLSLFKTSLSMDVVKERIRSLDSGRCHDSEGVARCLISLLNDTQPEGCESLLRFRWIPTNRGLKSPIDSRDFLSHNGRTDLFDEGMPLVSSDVAIGPFLREAFGWNQRVTVKIMSLQITAVLRSGASPEARYRKVYTVVRELGTRDLRDEQISFLKRTLNFEKWVPTHSNTLEGVKFALLGEDDIPEVGFYSIAFDTIRYSQICSFLSTMGCVDRPTKETIFERLDTLYHNQSTGTTSDRFVHGVVRMLAWLSPLDPNDRTKVYVPDEDGLLWPYDSIYFNDVGARAGLHDLGSGSLAHSAVSLDLASNLGLLRLGLMGFQNETTIDNVDWVSAIRVRLENYEDQRLLLDMISVASDARATEVNILLDDAWGPTEALLSPRCNELQNSPTLVFQHNGNFIEEDLFRILRYCSTQRDNKLSIGQYGHGALSIFHITEFAMIISQDQVWFFNPCKAYMSIDKAILQLPLSVVWRSYGDHLAPLIGLFGFCPPEDPPQEAFYNGTIFRLPLRASVHSPDVNPIFTRTASFQSLSSDLESLAPKCLLFSSLDSISLHDRPKQSRSTQQMPDSRLQWRMNSIKKDFRHSRDDVKAHTVIISNPMSMQRDHEWRVLTLDATTMIPPALASLHRLYNPLDSSVVHIAAQLDLNPGQVHSLFSTIPYLITADLPVHVSCPFILTPDMASIRLDETQGPEDSYNRWLLTAVLPILYLCMLEDRALVADNSPYWPGESKVAPEDMSTDISTLVGKAVYQMAMGETSAYTMFRSRFHPVAHPPRVARFATKIPRVVVAILEILKPVDIVQLSPTVIKLLKEQNSRHFSVVAPKYLHKQLSDHPEQFSASSIDRQQLQELIDFLSADNEPLGCLSGLSLLPLDDETFTKFGSTTSTTTFYAAPREVLEARVFNPDRLVHRALDYTKLLTIVDLNIKPINAGNIKDLLNDRINDSDVLQDADTDKQQWISSFWQVFPLLQISIKALLKYPLIPTLKTGHYFSLAFCKTSAILANFSKQPEVSRALAQMGLIVVNIANLSPDLQRALPPSPLVLSAVLTTILNRDKAEITNMFNALDPKTRPAIFSWIRSDWRKRKRLYFLRNPGYRNSIPIWRVADGSYLPAREVRMLPKTVTVNSIGPFSAKNLVGHDFVLVEMGLVPPPIRTLLDIPPELKPDHDEPYRDLLLKVLFNYTPKNEGIPVPNSQRMMRDSNTLYHSRDELFIAAFGLNSEYFIHPVFAKFQTQLESHGLMRQYDLNLKMFRTCVEAFHNTGGEINGERMTRADVLFWYWGEELPEQLTILDQDKLSTLDDFRFISRHLASRPLGSVNYNKYITHQLPAIVSPNELVRSEFVPIAWTQRASYKPRFQPHPDLIKLHPSLSVPTAEEVVKHLVVLATQVVRALDMSCRSIFLDHLEQTYMWLDQHTDEAKPFLQKCSADEVALFLNTEVPHMTPTGDWSWKRAEHILLNSDIDRGYLQYPRVFIKPFQYLLVAGGAVTIDYGKDVESTVALATDEDRQTDLYSNLNRMRRNGICIDVNFSFSSIDDQLLLAHRTYLAAYSPYFMKLFSDPEMGDTKMTVIHVDESYSRRCVEFLLDYAYTSEEPDLSREGDNRVQLALEFLLLAHYWEMSDAQRVMQDMIIKLKMVDPFKLAIIHEAARRTESKELIDHCDDFAERNSVLIGRVKEQTQSQA